MARVRNLLNILWTDSNELTEQTFTTVFEAFNFGVNTGSKDFKIINARTGKVESHYTEEEEDFDE